jgi:hypothetical protein
VYLPDLPSSEYENLLRSLEEEFTYAFGGASIVRGLEGSYLSESGERIPDRINIVYSDLPVALSTNFEIIAAYVGELKKVSMEALSEAHNKRLERTRRRVFVQSQISDLRSQISESRDHNR